MSCQFGVSCDVWPVTAAGVPKTAWPAGPGRRYRPLLPGRADPDPAASRMQKVIHMTSRHGTTTLWRPTGPKELDLVRN
ncbi:hypothetical protein SAV31267_098890 [Streptomyces avermitilis]|uniref:Uncharacterized protein n=1 Tax=Streptomyces avermitilis TaxID=33903 RepID=A0A4D4N901_STRAX|nr:hypothetical protein SAV31267_098890 [Streptomyces avermitilis]